MVALDAGEWVINNYRAGDVIELKSINLSFPIEQIYRGIIFERSTGES